MKVTIIYGEISYSWLLDHEEEVQLYEKLRLLNGTFENIKSADKNHPYKGIQVLLDATENLFVYNGLIESRKHVHEIRIYRDVNRRIEEWLFDKSVNKINNDVYMAIVLDEFSKLK